MGVAISLIARNLSGAVRAITRLMAITIILSWTYSFVASVRRTNTPVTITIILRIRNGGITTTCFTIFSAWRWIIGRCRICCWIRRSLITAGFMTRTIIFIRRNSTVAGWCLTIPLMLATIVSAIRNRLITRTFITIVGCSRRYYRRDICRCSSAWGSITITSIRITVIVIFTNSAPL